MTTKPHNPSISGQKGGEATLSRHGINHFRYAGQKGGDALVTKYGRDHFIALGRKSAAARARKRGEEPEEDYCPSAYW